MLSIPVRPLPPPGACHLWLAHVDRAPGSWSAILARDDTLAIERQRSPTGRQVTFTSRALQRLVAAGYLAMAPAAVPIRRRCPTCGAADHGRPTVENAPFDFSVSHSGSWVAMAVAANGSGALGLDLEEAGNLPDADALASTVLAPGELAIYQSMTRHRRRAWLFRMWARKEAALKAFGDGLRIDPQALDVHGPTTVVPLPDGDTAGHRRRAADAHRRLHLRDVDLRAGYAAAIASAPAPVDRVWAHVVTPEDSIAPS